jgi:RNA polymerase sigma-70 factor (ECF subfamily)
MPSRARASLSLVVGRSRDEVGDRALAEGLAAQEAWAINEAWSKFAPLVLGMAERALGSKADAEDMTQEVFVRLLRRVNTLREPEKLRSFVYSIALRTLQSHLRTRRFKNWLTFQAPDTLTDLGRVTLDVESRDLLRRFYAMLDRLSPRDRVVFALRRLEAMTVEEIAANMSLSVSTVKRSMRHASTRLSRLIDDDPELERLLRGRLDTQ